MCIAAPAKIIEIDREHHIAKASVAGNILDVNVRLVSVKEGDYVLLHAGCAVEVLRQDSAEEILSLLAELEELGRE